jgi:hypothetical protein
MPVPRTFSTLRRFRMFPALLLLSATVFCHAKGPEPPLRVPLEPLGYQPQNTGAMAIGAMSTVEFLDEQHLLVTFAVHRLMKRLPDDPPDDQDRTIEAVVVHLPSGKAIARTQWRVHDTGQYLWNLGHGRLLLRNRDTLSTIAPLVNLESSDPFIEQPLLTSSRVLVVVLLSPDRDLLTVETVARPSVAADGSLRTAESTRAQLNFYRVRPPAHPADKLILLYAGVMASDAPVNLSLTSAGYIDVSQESHDRWLFDFDPYAGKPIELSPFDTSCRPHPFFVSSSEFVAFGCRGSEDRQTIGGFNMTGEQMWQQDFTDIQAFANFTAAPAAGRFAISRNIVSVGSGMTPDFAPASFTAQEIRVYQTHDGRQLLRIEASPVQRFGDNYDLSPDGLRLAVIRGGAVEVHTLPALTEGDKAAILKAKALQPQDVQAAVSLMSHHKAADVAAVPAGASMVPQLIVSPPSPQDTVGDPPTEERRKPPTLYTLPTDPPQEKPQ